MNFKMFKLLVIALASLSLAALPQNAAALVSCEELRRLHDNARDEIIAHGHLLREKILRSENLPLSIDKYELGDVLFNTYTFTANYTWEIFEEDCTTFVTTGDIPQIWTLPFK